MICLKSRSVSASNLIQVLKLIKIIIRLLKCKVTAYDKIDLIYSAFGNVSNYNTRNEFLTARAYRIKLLRSQRPNAMTCRNVTFEGNVSASASLSSLARLRVISSFMKLMLKGCLACLLVQATDLTPLSKVHHHGTSAAKTSG